MKKKLLIEGMSCQHCVNHVTEALEEIEGVQNVTVNLTGKFAEVQLAGEIEEARFKNALEEAGYELIKVESL